MLQATLTLHIYGILHMVGCDVIGIVDIQKQNYIALNAKRVHKAATFTTAEII